MALFGQIVSGMEDSKFIQLPNLQFQRDNKRLKHNMAYAKEKTLEIVEKTYTYHQHPYFQEMMTLNENVNSRKLTHQMHKDILKHIFMVHRLKIEHVDPKHAEKNVSDIALELRELHETLLGYRRNRSDAVNFAKIEKHQNSNRDRRRNAHNKKPSHEHELEAEEFEAFLKKPYDYNE